MDSILKTQVLERVCAKAKALFTEFGMACPYIREDQLEDYFSTFIFNKIAEEMEQAIMLSLPANLKEFADMIFIKSMSGLSSFGFYEFCFLADISCDSALEFFLNGQEEALSDRIQENESDIILLVVEGVNYDRSY